MSSSFAYEDPLLRPQAQANLNNTQKAREIFKDMGKGMWRSGKGFGKVGALFSGLECAVESVSCYSEFLPRLRFLTILLPIVPGEKRYG